MTKEEIIKHWWIWEENRTACNMSSIDMQEQGVLIATRKSDVTCRKCLIVIRVPNKLTQETIEKSARGEDLHRFNNVDELIKDLESE